MTRSPWIRCAVVMLAAWVLVADTGCTRADRYTVRPGSTASRSLHDPLGDSVSWIDRNVTRGHRARVELYYWARLVRAPADVDRQVLYAMTLASEADTLTILEHVLSRHPKHYWAHLGVGRAHARAARWPEAENAYRRCIAINALEAGGHLGLAQALLATGREADAEKVYRDILEERPYDARMLTALGDLLRSRGTVDEALASYRRAAAADEKSADALVGIGELLLERDDDEGALAAAEAAAEADPESGRAHVLRARLYVRSGLRDQAAEAFARAAEVDPERMRTDDGLRHEAATLRGTVALEREAWKEAAARFAEAVAARPDDLTSFRALATARFADGDYAGAIHALVTAERLAPGDAAVARALAAVIKRMGIERMKNPGSATSADALAAVNTCFEAQRYRFPSLAGGLTLLRTADAGGRVSSVTFETDTVRNPELLGCAALHYLDARVAPGEAVKVDLSWEPEEVVATGRPGLSAPQRPGPAPGRR